MEGEDKPNHSQSQPQIIKFRGQCVPITQIINKQVKDIGTNEEMKMNSVSAFELFKAVYENKVTAVHLTEMSTLQFENFLKWIHPSHIAQPNLRKQYLSFTKSLKLTISSTIQFQLQSQQTSSVLSGFCQFSKLFLSLSDITVVIKLGSGKQVQEWKASLRKLWQSLTTIKKIKIEIRGEGVINSSLALSLRSVLFGGLACLTEISHLSFFKIRFTSIGTNDSLAIQQTLRTVFQKNKINSLRLEQYNEFPIFRGDLGLSAIDVTYNKNLAQLNLSSNKISAINVNHMINLTQLRLQYNKIFAINISHNINLTQLYLNDNQLFVIDVSNNINLTQLKLQYNKLSAINIRNTINLTELNLSSNQLSAIDVSKNINLSHLDLRNNKLSVIDLSNNLNLTHLYLSYNQLSTIDVSHNTNLTQLYLWENQLSAIDVSKNINLTQLWLSDNQLSVIDVSNSINLTQLKLSDNKLSVINVSSNINLTQLYLNRNQLSVIDVSNCTKLTQLSLSDNSLKSILFSFSSLLKDTDFSNQRSFVCKVQLLYSEDNFQRCNERAKEWTEGYRKGGKKNKHGCNYAFVCLKRK